jgi:GT2 family glycosyltransferase
MLTRAIYSTMLIFNKDRNLLEKTLPETLEILLRDPTIESRQSRHSWVGRDGWPDGAEEVRIGDGKNAILM